LKTEGGGDAKRLHRPAWWREGRRWRDAHYAALWRRLQQRILNAAADSGAGPQITQNGRGGKERLECATGGGRAKGGEC
jgi:hypothetical protein